MILALGGGDWDAGIPEAITWSTTSGATLSNSNRTAAVASGYGGASSAQTKNSGKWYFEVSFDSWNSSNTASIGLVNGSWSFGAAQIVSGTNSAGFSSSGNAGSNGSIASYFAGFAAPKVVGIAADLDGNASHQPTQRCGPQRRHASIWLMVPDTPPMLVVTPTALANVLSMLLVDALPASTYLPLVKKPPAVPAITNGMGRME